MIGLDVGLDLNLPLVPVLQQLLLVVQQLLVGLGGVLEVGPFHDGVHRASLLAEAAVNALGHVNVVPVDRSEFWLGFFVLLT